MRVGVIYKVTNKVNGKAYIGKTIQAKEARWRRHVTEAQVGLGFALHAAIRKYGAESFRFRVLKRMTEHLLSAAEVYFIARHNTFGVQGYNLTRGGEGVTMTPRIRKKIGRAVRAAYVNDITYGQRVGAAVMKALTGRTLPEVHIERLVTGLLKYHRDNPGSKIGQGKGRKISQSTKKKIAKAHIGLKHTPESISKMAELARQRWAINHAKYTAAIKAGRAKSSKCSSKALSKQATKMWSDEETRGKFLTARQGRPPMKKDKFTGRFVKQVDRER